VPAGRCPTWQKKPGSQQPSAPRKAGPACSVMTPLRCHSVTARTRFLFPMHYHSVPQRSITIPSFA